MCKQQLAAHSAQAPSIKLGTTWCDRHQLSISAGHWSKDVETMRFPVWEAELPRTLCNKYFPEKLPFVKGYQKAECLFQDTLQAAQVRNEVHRECAALFGSCSKKTTVTGSSEFLSAIGFGFRDSKPQVYAFVITVDCRLRFCEGAAEVMHVTMGDAGKEILFAGEFFVVHEAGRYWLCVTNNSGSFKPSMTRLEQAKQLFAELLGDVAVEPLEMDNPRIKELTTRHRGDPLHMGHSIHHPQPAEERSAAQIKSALVIMGRGNEVQGYKNPCISHQRHPGQSPRQFTKSFTTPVQRTHRRVKTWDTTPEEFAGHTAMGPLPGSIGAQTENSPLKVPCLAGSIDAQTTGQTTSNVPAQSSIATAANNQGQARTTSKDSCKQQAKTTSTPRVSTSNGYAYPCKEPTRLQYSSSSAVFSSCRYVYPDPFASSPKSITTSSNTSQGYRTSSVRTYSGQRMRHNITAL